MVRSATTSRSSSYSSQVFFSLSIFFFFFTSSLLLLRFMIVFFHVLFFFVCVSLRQRGWLGWTMSPYEFDRVSSWSSFSCSHLFCSPSLMAAFISSCFIRPVEHWQLAIQIVKNNHNEIPASLLIFLWLLGKPMNGFRDIGVGVWLFSGLGDPQRQHPSVERLEIYWWDFAPFKSFTHILVIDSIRLLQQHLILSYPTPVFDYRYERLQRGYHVRDWRSSFVYPGGRAGRLIRHHIDLYRFLHYGHSLSRLRSQGNILFSFSISIYLSSSSTIPSSTSSSLLLYFTVSMSLPAPHFYLHTHTHSLTQRKRAIHCWEERCTQYHPAHDRTTLHI